MTNTRPDGVVVLDDGTIIGRKRRLNFLGGVTLTDQDEHVDIDITPTITPLTMHAPGGATTWTNMPAALTAFLAVTTQNTQFDMSAFTQARLVAQIQVAGSGSAKLRVQHGDGFTWDYLDGSSEPSLDISSAGLKVSSWVTLESAARADRILRLVGIDGDGAADPDFGLIVVQFR